MSSGSSSSQAELLSGTPGQCWFPGHRGRRECLEFWACSLHSLSPNPSSLRRGGKSSKVSGAAGRARQSLSNRSESRKRSRSLPKQRSSRSTGSQGHGRGREKERERKIKGKGRKQGRVRAGPLATLPESLPCPIRILSWTLTFILSLIRHIHSYPSVS